MPITISQLEKFKKISCYKCYDPIRKNLPNEDLAWDNFQTVHSELDSVYETPNATNNKQSFSVGQGSTGLNSFGTATNLSRQLVDTDPIDSYIEQLLETKQGLQEQLQEMSSEGTDDEKKDQELPLPPTLGEHQMKYLDKWRSIRNVLELRYDGCQRTNSYTPDERRDHS